MNSLAQPTFLITSSEDVSVAVSKDLMLQHSQFAKRLIDADESIDNICVPYDTHLVNRLGEFCAYYIRTPMRALYGVSLSVNVLFVQSIMSPLLPTNRKCVHRFCPK